MTAHPVQQMIAIDRHFDQLIIKEKAFDLKPEKGYISEQKGEVQLTLKDRGPLEQKIDVLCTRLCF